MNGYRCQLCTAIVWERDLEEHPCRAGWVTVNLAPDEDEEVPEGWRRCRKCKLPPDAFGTRRYCGNRVAKVTCKTCSGNNAQEVCDDRVED